MSSGGAAWRYDFHAGAWLRQAPAFGGAVFRSRTLSQSHASASGRQRPCTATQGIGLRVQAEELNKPRKKLRLFPKLPKISTFF